MIIQNNPELQKLTLELSHEEAAIVSEALKAAHEAASETGKVLHPLLSGIQAELRHIAVKLGLKKAE